MKRTGLIALAVISTFVISACSTTDTRVAKGSGGEAFEEISNIRTLYATPVTLPGEIHGDATEEELAELREVGPMRGARMLASGVSGETSERIVGISRQDAPESGYYVDFQITYLDLGDRELESGVFGSDEAGWSHVQGTGVIYSGETGEVVAELTLDESSGDEFAVRYENNLKNIGRKVGEWLEQEVEKQKAAQQAR